MSDRRSAVHPWDLRGQAADAVTVERVGRVVGAPAFHELDHEAARGHSRFLPAATTPGCAGPTDCTNAAAALACTDSLGCGTDGKCRFAVHKDAACQCAERDIRWCPNRTDQVQFCVRTDPASTAAASWQLDTTKTPPAAICGPTMVPCSTGKPVCPTGTVGSKYDEGALTWIPDPNGTCTPDPPCPQVGALRECDTGNVTCPKGTQLYDGNDWTKACQPHDDCTGCVGNEGAACGACGGTVACDGSCNALGPANLGAGCGCGGTIQCDGTCSQACAEPATQHDLKLVSSNVDDNAYVWLDHPGSVDQAVCRIDDGNVPRSGQCDLAQVFRDRGMTGARVVIKIGNGGGFNAAALSAAGRADRRG